MRIYIVAIAALISFVGCKEGMPGAAEPPHVEILTKEYLDSKEDFKKKYQGKEITVSGLVDRKASLISETIGGSIHLGGWSGESKDTIECRFDTSDSEVFLQRSPGGPLTVKGIVDVSGNGSELQIKFCKFVWTN